MDSKIILGKWKQDFEQMHNLQAPCNNEIDLQMFDKFNQDYAYSADASDFCCPITLGKVHKAELRARVGRPKTS